MIHTPRPCVRTFYSCLLLAGLGACSLTPSVNELPPPNYSIAGVWELNAALSTDADKTLASLQPKPRGQRGNGAPSSAPAPEVINDPTTDLPPIDISNGGRGRAFQGYDADRNAPSTVRPSTSRPTPCSAANG